MLRPQTKVSIREQEIHVAADGKELPLEPFEVRGSLLKVA
jgi:hypothetical protein